MFKTLISTLLILIFILFIEVFSISLFTLSMPNQLVITVFDNFSFYMSLFNVNPVMAIEQALIKNPILIVQRLDELQMSQVWGLYFMPINIVTLFLLSLYLNSVKKMNINPSGWIWIFIASFILMASMFYLRIQTCCTSDPTWVLDIWLFSQVSSPLVDTALWQKIYIQISDHFTLIQFSLTFSSAAILFRIYISSLQNKNK